MLFRPVLEKPEILDHFQGGKGHLEAYPMFNGVEEMQGMSRWNSLHWYFIPVPFDS